MALSVEDGHAPEPSSFCWFCNYQSPFSNGYSRTWNWFDPIFVGLFNCVHCMLFSLFNIIVLHCTHTRLTLTVGYAGPTPGKHFRIPH